MPVKWDSVLTRAVAHELNDRLRGERCQAYRLDAPSRAVWLFLEGTCLELALGATAGTLSLHPATEPHRDARPLNAHLLEVAPFPDERRLRFAFQRRRGQARRLDLVVEWAINRRNAVLVVAGANTVED